MWRSILETLRRPEVKKALGMAALLVVDAVVRVAIGTSKHR